MHRVFWGPDCRSLVREGPTPQNPTEDRMRPIECVNGCGARVQAPSKVLCAACLGKLNRKFEDLRTLLQQQEQR